jgi:hypothetical protein
MYLALYIQNISDYKPSAVRGCFGSCQLRVDGEHHSPRQERCRCCHSSAHKKPISRIRLYRRLTPSAIGTISVRYHWLFTTCAQNVMHNTSRNVTHICTSRMFGDPRIFSFSTIHAQNDRPNARPQPLPKAPQQRTHLPPQLQPRANQLLPARSIQHKRPHNGPPTHPPLKPILIPLYRRTTTKTSRHTTIATTHSPRPQCL